MYKRIQLFWSLLLLGTFVLGHSHVKAETLPDTIAFVGQLEISESDVSHKMALEKVYGNITITENAALVSLVNSAIEREIARLNGIKAEPEEIAAFSRHADETSKAPEILAALKEVFGDDINSYNRIYIEPKIINKKLRYWYSRNAEIHAKQRQTIENAYSLAYAGKPMQQTAEELGLNFTKLDNKPKDPNSSRSTLLQQYFSNDANETKDPMAAIAEELNESQLYNNIVEDGYSYKVIKLIAKDKNHYEFESVVVRKFPFDKWFADQAENIAITIPDEKLKQQLAEAYPDIWWIKKMCEDNSRKIK